MVLIEGGAGERGGDHRRLPADTLTLTAAVSLMVAIIHAALAPEHFEESVVFGSFFVVAAGFQTAWAVAVYRGASPAWLRAGAVVNAAVVAVWVLSRTVGLPFGAESWTPEAVGVPDTIATLDELLIVWLALAVLPARARPSKALVPLIVPVAATLIVLSLTALMLSGGHHGGGGHHAGGSQHAG